MTSVLLNTAYLPNISYFYYLLNSETPFIEACEHYEKQSFRNRCEILTANGKLSLSIPLIKPVGSSIQRVKQSDKEIISQKRISYAENWQINHWRTVTSAYKNSPYFEYFEDEFKPFYTEKYDLLFDYNLQLIKCVLKVLKQTKEIQITNSFEIESTHLDLRNKIHPKIKIVAEGVPTQPYQQVFSDKFGFVNNLSVMDLLFNKGLETIEYLRRVSVK